jgi:nicotinamidase-related amidase
MSESDALPRSPELMSRHDTALLVVDVQTKLLAWIPNQTQMVWNIRRLIDGCRALDMTVLGSEQYPAGLGYTTPELAERLGELPSKMMFSCRECSGLWRDLQNRGLPKVLVVGIEAHVCVQQTALDLLASGMRVYVAVDATGSRFKIDYETALRRMETHGATLTTTEAALFEWCETAGTPEFKKISALVRERLPSPQ